MKVTLMIPALLVPAILATSDLRPEETEFFETHIRPVLVDHCYGCHSKEAGKHGEACGSTPRLIWLAGGGNWPRHLARRS